MKVAIVGAGFTAVEADRCAAPWRRSSSPAASAISTTSWSRAWCRAAIPRLRRAHLQADRGGFGSYGFPERPRRQLRQDRLCQVADEAPSSRRLLRSAGSTPSRWAFIPPPKVVRDAREHGVEVRPACINASRWDCTLEPTAGRYLAVRLGLRQVRGLANAHGAAIVATRGTHLFQSVGGMCGGAPAYRGARSSDWPKRMPSMRWAWIRRQG